MSSARCSAVIATADREIHLAEMLVTFENQTHPFNEIVIADGSATRLTKQVVMDWASRLPLLYIKCSKKGAAEQRDEGTKRSFGDIIFFLDDDVLLEQYFVEEIMAVFERDDAAQVGGVSGTITNQTYGRPSRITSFYLCIMAGGHRDRYDGTVIGPGINLLPADEGCDERFVDWMPSSVCAYRRNVFEKVGGFGKLFHGYSMCEDLHLSSRVARQWVLVNTRRARLFHKDLGAKTHEDWREIGRMSVANRWVVVRDVLDGATKINMIKLVVSLLFWWATAIRAVWAGQEPSKVAWNRMRGQFDGFVAIIRGDKLT